MMPAPSSLTSRDGNVGWSSTNPANIGLSNANPANTGLSNVNGNVGYSSKDG